MAIIYPKIITENKGVTAGALRQLKQFGHTTASGGLMSVGFLRKQVSVDDMSVYLDKREPLGEFMSALEKTSDEIIQTTGALTESTHKMVDAAREASKQLNDISGKMRDGAEKLGAAMDKFGKIANNANFAETAKTAASLVDSLERLAKLQESGALDKVIKAMSK